MQRGGIHAEYNEFLSIRPSYPFIPSLSQSCDCWRYIFANPCQIWYSTPARFLCMLCYLQLANCCKFANKKSQAMVLLWWVHVQRRLAQDSCLSFFLLLMLDGWWLLLSLLLSHCSWRCLPRLGNGHVIKGVTSWHYTIDYLWIRCIS